MSEHFESSTEQQSPAPEALPQPERHPPKHNQHEKHARKLEQDPSLKLKEARHAVHETAQAQPSPLEDLKADSEKAAPPPKRIDREMKKIYLQRELGDIRRKLPAADRALSKIIHQPVVRAVSETAAKTVSRPSGLLGGGLVALLGTTGYLYLARHIGFTYNYGVFLLLFVGGFAVGVILELLVHSMTASRRQVD